CHATTYIRKVNKRIAEESHRVATTLTPQNERTLLRVVEERLIESNIKDVLNMENGLRKMLDTDSFADISAVYQLVLRVDKNLSVVKRIVSGRIIEMGRELIASLGNVPGSGAAKPTSSEGGAGAEAESSKSTSIQEDKALSNATTLAIDWVDK